LGFIFLGLLLVSAFAWGADGAPIDLTVGKDRELVLPGVTKAEVQSPGIAAAQIAEGATVKLKGLAPGQTALTLYTGSEAHRFEIQVTGESAKIQVGVGEQKTLLVEGVNRVAIGDDGIADVRVIGDNQIVIDGKSGGGTQIIAWTTTGQRRAYALNVTPGAVEQPSVRVEVGSVAVITVKGLKRIAVGDPAIADVRATSDMIQVQGVAEGKTTLLAWDNAGKRVAYLVHVTR
jgi:Flp pilus assembly secretin CpaC